MIPASFVLGLNLPNLLLSPTSPGLMTAHEAKNEAAKKSVIVLMVIDFLQKSASRHLEKIKICKNPGMESQKSAMQRTVNHQSFWKYPVYAKNVG